MNLGEQMWCVLSEEMSFKTFTPILCHVNEDKTRCLKTLALYLTAAGGIENANFCRLV